MAEKIEMWKMTLFKNASEEGGAMAMAIASADDKDIILHSQKQNTGRLWGYCSPEHLLKLIEKNKGLYEVITKFPHKIYFDIDKDNLQPEEYLQDVKKIIESFFPSCEMAISGSYTDKKTSFHIILQNYMIHNEDERNQLKHLVIHIQKTIDDGFDWKVYTKNRNMKCINQSKDDKRIQQIIENPNYKDHCITSFFTNHPLVFPNLEVVKEEIMIAKSKKTFDLGLLPKLVLKVPMSIDNINECSCSELLLMVPLNKSFDHNYTHRIARFCFYNDLQFETFYKWILNKHEDKMEIKTKWSSHWNNLNKFPEVSKNNIISLLCNFYPEIKKTKSLRDFQQSFVFDSNVEKIETIIPDCFNQNNKYLLFNIGMGGGKTAQTIDYLKNKGKLLWIAPNKALALNTQQRFNEKDIPISHYLEFSKSMKDNGELDKLEHLIIVLNSLHYITECKYDIIIIDEIETVLDKFLGDFLEGKNELKKKIWDNFVACIKNAKQVIFLDAFITTKTINLIKQIEQDSSITIFERKFEPQTRTIKYVDDYENMIGDIITKIKNNQKVFIFSPYKRTVKNYHSMEALFDVITKATGKQGIFYNADVDDKIKKQLKDVNTAWKDKHFIITNNIITCGVNYEKLDFDYKYLFIASHNTPRDIIQVSYRARFLSSGIIKVHFMGKMNQTNTWVNDCKRMKCPIYTSLFNNILIEKKAPLRSSFNFFCHKAHYKQELEKLTIDAVLTKEISALFENHKMSYSYELIEDIDYNDIDRIEQNMINESATMYEKFQLKKYYFKNSFKNNQDPLLSFIWDDNHFFFFDQLKKVLNQDTHLFNEIAKLNELSFLFPVDVKKMKLSTEIRKRIFVEFSFKYINTSSGKNHIVKEIYNAFFGNQINTWSDENNNVTYVMSDHLQVFVEFGRENLYICKQPNEIINNEIIFHNKRLTYNQKNAGF